MSESTDLREFDGDVAISGNVSHGGDLKTGGNAHILGDVWIDGWLHAPNIVGLSGGSNGNGNGNGGVENNPSFPVSDVVNTSKVMVPSCYAVYWAIQNSGFIKNTDLGPMLKSYVTRDTLAKDYVTKTQIADYVTETSMAKAVAAALADYATKEELATLSLQGYDGVLLFSGFVNNPQIEQAGAVPGSGTGGFGSAVVFDSGRNRFLERIGAKYYIASTVLVKYQNGDEVYSNKLYIDKSEYVAYFFTGTTLRAVGGGGGSTDAPDIYAILRDYVSKEHLEDLLERTFVEGIDVIKEDTLSDDKDKMPSSKAVKDAVNNVKQLFETLAEKVGGDVFQKWEGNLYQWVQWLLEKVGNTSNGVMGTMSLSEFIAALSMWTGIPSNDPGDWDGKDLKTTIIEAVNNNIEKQRHAVRVTACDESGTIMSLSKTRNEVIYITDADYKNMVAAIDKGVPILMRGSDEMVQLSYFQNLNKVSFGFVYTYTNGYAFGVYRYANQDSPGWHVFKQEANFLFDSSGNSGNSGSQGSQGSSFTINGLQQLSFDEETAPGEIMLPVFSIKEEGNRKVSLPDLCSFLLDEYNDALLVSRLGDVQTYYMKRSNPRQLSGGKGLGFIGNARVVRSGPTAVLIVETCYGVDSNGDFIPVSDENPEPSTLKTYICKGECSYTGSVMGWGEWFLAGEVPFDGSSEAFYVKVADEKVADEKV